MERDPPFPTTEGGAAAAGGVMGSFSKEELRKLYSDDPFCAAEIAHAAGVDDTRRMLAVLKGIFERLKRTMRELGVVELSEKLVSALALSLEQTTKNAQVGELASAVLALFVEHCSPEGRAALQRERSMVPALAAVLGGDGTAQARVFAGLVLRVALRGGGSQQATAVLSIAGLPEALERMLQAGALEEVRCALSLIGALLYDGGEPAAAILTQEKAVARTLLASLAPRGSRGLLSHVPLEALWAVSLLGMSKTGRDAIAHAGAAELLTAAEADIAAAAQRSPAPLPGVYILAVVNALGGVGLGGALLREQSLSWSSDVVYVELWQVLYSLAALSSRADMAQPLLASGAFLLAANVAITAAAAVSAVSTADVAVSGPNGAIRDSGASGATSTHPWDAAADSGPT
ncbi:hypothetical protein T484DRAFT_1889143, partial [Baffinella frigidus]